MLPELVSKTTSTSVSAEGANVPQWKYDYRRVKGCDKTANKLFTASDRFRRTSAGLPSPFFFDSFTLRKATL